MRCFIKLVSIQLRNAARYGRLSRRNQARLTLTSGLLKEMGVRDDE